MLNRKKLAAYAATSLVSGLVFPFIGVQPADAASAVRISAAQYDSPGSDEGSNSSLNAEWVRITNNSSSRKSLSGWTLRDTSGHVYRFGTFSLGAGNSVEIYTGKGSNTASNRYWGSGGYIWNNTGDKAILKTGAGVTVDTCSWPDGDGTASC